MNYKETAEMLESCGLTQDTYGAVANALIYQHRRDNSRCDPETPWQTGFADCLRQLESEAMQISAFFSQRQHYVCTFNSTELDLLYEVVRQVRNEHDPDWQPEPGSWGHAICQLDIKLTEMFHKRRR